MQCTTADQQLHPLGLQLQSAARPPPYKLFKGVSTYENGKFAASITICGHTVQLGVVDSIAQAVKAHDVTALALFGPDAAVNFPAESYSLQEIAVTKKMLLREQQQSQVALCWSARSVSGLAPAVAAGSATAGRDAPLALDDRAEVPAVIAADAHAVVQPAAGNKRATHCSSDAAAAAAAPTSGDSRCVQEQPLEQGEQSAAADAAGHSPFCSLLKPAPSTMKQQQSPLPGAHLAPSSKDQQQMNGRYQMPAGTAAAAANTEDSWPQWPQWQPSSKDSTGKLLPDACALSAAATQQQQQQQQQQQHGLEGMQPAAGSSAAVAAAVAGAGRGQQDRHAAYAAACQQPLNLAGSTAPGNPSMLNGLLCLIEAAASLPAEDQAVLLPASARRSHPVSSTAQHQQQQARMQDFHQADDKEQPSAMLQQQHEASAGHDPATAGWAKKAAEQGSLLQVPASSQQAPPSQRPEQPPVQGQQAFPAHSAQQQQPAGQLAGELDAMHFLQTDAGKLAVQQLTQQFQQQHQVRDWQEFLQSSSAQQSLLNLQLLYNQTAGSPMQHPQPQQQQLPSRQQGHHQLAASRLAPAVSALPGQQQQQQQMIHRLLPPPAGTRTVAAAAAAGSFQQQLGHTQWLPRQQQPPLEGPGQGGSRMTSLQLALSAGASALPAAGSAAAAAAARLFQRAQQQQQGEKAAAAAHLKPRTSHAGSGPRLLSHGSSSHSHGSTYRSSRSASPDADDDAAAGAAAGEAGRGRSVSADSGRSTAAAAAGADALAAMHAAAVAAGMYAAEGAEADDTNAYAAGCEDEAHGGAGAAFAMQLCGGMGKRHSARPKRQTERMQEMRQQLQEQHKQKKPKQQEQQQCDAQLLQDLWALFGRAGLPGQFEQALLQPPQQEFLPLQLQQQQQQQHLKRKRVNIAWKPAGEKAGSAGAARARSAAAAPAAAAAAAGSAVDDDTAAAADGGDAPAAVVKVTGPGCVSHAQNPTGQMGVRMRKSKYEAFIAVPPFRYLYLGQHTTAADAARTRDTAMLAIYGAEAAAAHGAAWLSPGAAGSIPADSVAALAAKLVKKEQVAGVMKQHGTYRLLLQAGTATAAGAVGAGAGAQG